LFYLKIVKKFFFRKEGQQMRSKFLRGNILLRSSFEGFVIVLKHIQGILVED
jgi:hypothetical protein